MVSVQWDPRQNEINEEYKRGQALYVAGEPVTQQPATIAARRALAFAAGAEGIGFDEFRRRHDTIKLCNRKRPKQTRLDSVPGDETTEKTIGRV